MGITDGAACPPVWSPVNPPVASLKHPVQVGHSRSPIGSWPPADPSLAVTQTDATGRQDHLSPQMGQLILLWPFLASPGGHPPLFDNYDCACRLAVIMQYCRSQEAPEVRLRPVYAGPCNARKRMRLTCYCYNTCCQEVGCSLIQLRCCPVSSVMPGAAGSTS